MRNEILAIIAPAKLQLQEGGTDSRTEMFRREDFLLSSLSPAT